MKWCPYTGMQNHEAIIKEAVVGALARGAFSLGKATVKSPMKAMTAGFGAYDIGSGGANLMNRTSARPLMQGARSAVTNM